MTVNGVPATVEDLAPLALVNYGAFTVMPVREGAVAGLDLHLRRLERWSLELFGAPCDVARVRGWMRNAVADAGDATLRVNLYRRDLTVRRPGVVAAPDVLVTVLPAAEKTEALKVATRAYGRERPDMKHVATFGSIAARREAILAGRDDVLFVDDEGRVAEGSIWNLGLFDGDTVVWPEAPMLEGVGQALLSEGLHRVGVDQLRRSVTLEEAKGLAAFAVNVSWPAGIEIAFIDGHAQPPLERRRRVLDRAAATIVPQPI